MKMRRIAVLAGVLAGCGSGGPTTRPAAAPAAPGKPEIGAWGFDLAGMDPQVAPGADFYRYANGRWLASARIPADKPLYAMFIQLGDLSDRRTRAIIESASGPPGSDGQRIGDYYKTFMDEAAIEARGIAPIQRWLDEIAVYAEPAIPRVGQTSGVRAIAGIPRCGPRVEPAKSGQMPDSLAASTARVLVAIDWPRS